MVFQQEQANDITEQLFRTRFQFGLLVRQQMDAGPQIQQRSTLMIAQIFQDHL